MNCERCGRELMGGVETFGDLNHEVCQGCWWAVLDERAKIAAMDELKQAIEKAEVDVEEKSREVNRLEKDLDSLNEDYSAALSRLTDLKTALQTAKELAEARKK